MVTATQLGAAPAREATAPLARLPPAPRPHPVARATVPTQLPWPSSSFSTPAARKSPSISSRPTIPDTPAHQGRHSSKHAKRQPSKPSQRGVRRRSDNARRKSWSGWVWARRWGSAPGTPSRGAKARILPATLQLQRARWAHRPRERALEGARRWLGRTDAVMVAGAAPWHAA